MFSNSERKARVAHTSQNPDLFASLERKRLQLAAISTKVTQGTKFSKSPTKRFIGSKAKRTKNTLGSDEEDEFIDDESEVEEEDINFSDDEMKKRKRPAVKTKEKASVVQPSTNNSASAKSRTLSESSEEEEWFGKPNVSNDGVSMKKMTTKVIKAPIKKKIILSDDSEDEAKPALTLKKVALVAQKHKKSRGDSSEEDNEFVEPDDNSDHGESTPSEDSDADERKKKKGESNLSRQSRLFFNKATKEELLATPRVTEKISAAILENRPFETFSDLEACVSKINRGKQALEAYEEYLENRGVLEKILDDCKGHAAEVERDFESCSLNKFQPSNLTPGYNLHEYQQVGLNWLIMMYRKGFNCILGDEMGLGKTIQIVAFLAWMKLEKIRGPHLIVVPSSTVENWMGELGRWCSDLQLLTYYGSQDERKQLRHMAKKRNDIDVILTTYNMVSSKSDDKKFFKNFSLNYVIYDEGHMLKNCSTERYRNLMKVKGNRKILLTGTPLQNNLIELISLMYFVMTKVFTKYCEDITQLLVHFKQQGPALDSSTSALYQKDRIEQAKQILQPYILRRLKSQVLTCLPPKYEEIVEVDMLEEQSEHYEYILESLRGADGDSNQAYGALIKLRQAANHPLLRRIEYTDKLLDKIGKALVSKEKPYEKKQWEHVSEDLSYNLGDFQIHKLCEKFSSTKKFLLPEGLALRSGKCEELDRRLPLIKEKGEKVLIFSQFTTMLDVLEVYMRLRGHSYKRLDGQTPVMERQEMINEFNTSSELFVFLLSTRAGGLGINLTSANHIIIHDIDFNPYNDKQAEDRCHRMGQKRPVYVTRLISKGSVETGIFSLARKKLQLEKEVTIGIKGQLEEDDEVTRDSSDSKEEKIDSAALQNILNSALKHRTVAEATPPDSP